MKKVILALLLCSCASGVEPEESIVEPDTGTFTPVKPSPVVEDSSSEESPRKCVVKSTQVNNCILTQVWCVGEDGGYQLEDQDVSCFNPRPLFPWEYIPDPPPYRHNHKEVK